MAASVDKGDVLGSSGIDPGEVTADVIHEFLEVAFHMILYIREIYPRAIFKRVQKYNVPVQMCVHPELNEYITSVLSSVRLLLDKKAIEKVVLTITSKANTVIERFVFDMKDTFVSSGSSGDDYLLQLETNLRSFLLKISVCDALLKPLPPDCSFAVLVYAKRPSMASLHHEQLAMDFPWIEIDEQEEQAPVNASIVSLKSVYSSILKMQLYVEENPSR